MTIEGTVVNGVLVFDGPPPPEGTRLRLEMPDADDDLWDELSKVPPPPTTETYEEHLANLRLSMQDAKDGLGRPLDEVMAEIAKEFNLPPVKRR